jgi:hypothetical protein
MTHESRAKCKLYWQLELSNDKPLLAHKMRAK